MSWRRDRHYDPYYEPYESQRVSYTFSRPMYDITPPSSRSVLRFSGTEKQHLVIAIAALTLAFTLFFSHDIYGRIDFDLFLDNIVVSFVAVVTAFFLHEVGHKYFAQRYGHRAEFRYWNIGLLIAVFAGYIGFLFAAPGAVYISGNVTTEQNGKISAAGPGMNMLVAVILLPVLVFSSGVVTQEYPTVNDFVGLVCIINVAIGGFNMIPLSPLDGSKIYPWSIPMYIGMLVGIGALLYATLTFWI